MSRTRLIKVIAMGLLAALVSISLVGCTSKPDTSKAAGTPQTITRGDVKVEILGSGNLALSQKEDLAFEMGGYVEEVSVKEGDAVTKGQVLARLDTSAWEDQIDALQKQMTAAERKLTTTQRDLATKERAVEAAERQVTTAERLVTTKELALRQAQISLETAQYNLSAIADVKKAQDAIDKAESDLKIAQALQLEAMKSDSPGGELQYWQDLINGTKDPITKETILTGLKQKLADAQKELKDVLAENSMKVTTTVALDITTKQFAVQQAQRQVDDAQIAVQEARRSIEDARVAVDTAKSATSDAKLAVEDAQESIKDVQTSLDELKSKSFEVKAPFAGFITKVNVAGGAEVKKGTVAVTIADPARFEADILVSELDIFKVALDSDATIRLDALPQVTLLSKVTRIAPTAAAQSGVVNYKVKVEVQSAQTTQSGSTSTSGRVFTGGRTAQGQGMTMTPEQLAQIRERMQQGGQRAGQTQTDGAQQSQAAASSFQLSQLKEGLTVAVSIPVQERTNVLLVPNRAITRQGTNSTVQVASATGTPEIRTIRTGITDSQNTEVLEGLSEGEKVIIPVSTAPASTRQQGGGPLMIPGVRR